MEQNKLNVFITFATTHYLSAYFANGTVYIHYTLYRTLYQYYVYMPYKYIVMRQPW